MGFGGFGGGGEGQALAPGGRHRGGRGGFVSEGTGVVCRMFLA